MSPADPSPSKAVATFESPIQPGSSVDVRSRFDGAWCGGFAVAEVVPPADGQEGPSAPQYRLRRQSDGAVLPRLFTPQEVVPTRVDRLTAKQFPRP
jgi:hypothetical protein